MRRQRSPYVRDMALYPYAPLFGLVIGLISIVSPIATWVAIGIVMAYFCVVCAIEAIRQRRRSEVECQENGKHSDRPDL
jgi:hypothetical protein